MLTDHQFQLARLRFSKQLQVLFELLPGWNSSSRLPDSSKGQKASVDFVGTVPDRHETLLLLGPLGRSAAVQLPETRALDKTIPGAHHSTAYLGLPLLSANT